MNYEEIRENINVSDRYDNDPLHIAAMKGYLPIVRVSLFVICQVCILELGYSNSLSKADGTLDYQSRDRKIDSRLLRSSDESLNRGPLSL